MKLILFFTITLSVQIAQSKELIIHAGMGCKIRVIVGEPLNTEPVADVLFLTGFADRADNHMPLFSQMADSGFRVISFDYPSHGKTKCWSLNTHSMKSLEGLAKLVLLNPSIHSERPLHLVGWSTGGLLAYRMLQRQEPNFRDVESTVLLAPGLAVYPIPGDWGKVTLESLSSNPTPPHRGPISPSSPLLYPLFGADLMATSLLARLGAVPDVPILMILADDDLDVYAKTPKIKKWYLKNKKESFISYQCPGAKHELANEINPIGNSVRGLILNHLTGSISDFSQRNCSKL